MKPNVLLLSPLSGAQSGVEYVTRATLDSPLKEVWNVTHIDTATVRRNMDRGFPTPRGGYLMAKMLGEVVHTCRHQSFRASIIQCARNRLGFIKFAILKAAVSRYRIPVIAKMGGGDFHLFYKWLSPVSQSFVKHTLRDCHVLVESENLRKQFFGTVPPERIHFSHLGIHGRTVQIKDVATKYLFSANKNILFVGYLSKAKGALDLLDAMEEIRGQVPNVKLTLLGEKIRKERNIVHIQNPHGAWKRVKALSMETAPGHISGIAKWRAFDDATIFVFPSYSEGFPVCVLEAMASGLPMVCTPVGALPEILEHGKHCRFVPIGDPEGIAKEVISLLKNPSDSCLMGARNLMEVREKYTLDHYAQNMRKALLDVITN